MKKSIKVPLILLIICILLSMVLFSTAKGYPNMIWGGAISAGLAIIFAMVTLTRFLRNRSIVSGLFLSTTMVTIIYFISTRFVSTALPMAFATANVVAAETTGTNAGLFTPIFFAQIGLFVIWFLIILFIIYVYVRPIKKIDFLLSQIIESKDIKKLSLGKSAQYKNIEAKLQVLASEKRALEVKRQNRLAKARAKANVKKDLVEKLVKEKEKIPSPSPAE